MLWETWVCFQGLSFMLKVVIEECFQITDVWNVNLSNFYYGNFFFCIGEMYLRTKIFLSSSGAKYSWVLCSSLKWSSCGWTDAVCSSLGRTEQTCPNWALFAVPLEGASHISWRCSALSFQVLKAWTLNTSQPWLCFNGKIHFTDFFCKCSFSFSSVSMVFSSLSTEIINLYIIIMSNGGN